MAVPSSPRRGGALGVFLGILASSGIGAAHVCQHWSPDRWAIPALAGLGFPLFGLVLILSMVMVVRRRRWRWFLLFGAVGFLSGSMYRSVWGGFGVGVASPQIDAPTWKVMGWNVRLYDRYHWLGEGSREGIFEAVSSESPDVLCVQEHLQDEETRSWQIETSMRTALQKEGGQPEVHEVWARQTSTRKFGVATWSIHPIVRRESMLFGTSSNNACAVTDIAWNADTIRVFNAHFASLHFGSEEYAALEDGIPDAEGRGRIWSRMKDAYADRVSQVRVVMEAVSRSPYPVILCGDFNDVPVSWALAQMRDALLDVHDVRSLRMDGTWQGPVPGVRIDHIFVDPLLPVLDYSTGGQGLSDHRYVAAAVQGPIRSSDPVAGQ